MGKSAIDANINQSLFRKDSPIIIARRRDLASISMVRLKYNADGYMPGQVLAQDTNGVFDKYSAISRSADAMCILFDQVRAEDQDSAATAGALARALYSGHVFTDLLIDYDSGAKSDLGATDQSDASGIQITKF